MDTLRDRLAELADDAPTAGAPAAELWARGKRAHRLRAAALAATLLVVGAVGTGVGLRLSPDEGNRTSPMPAKTVGFALPIEYPVRGELPDLGPTPGPLVAIWLAPRKDGDAPGAVGLVAETGTFGTLPIGLPDDDSQAPEELVVALSPDGRRIAYLPQTGGLIVRDLVSGESYSPLTEFETRAGFKWIDATTLLGHVAGGYDGDGWLWQTGTSPKLVNPYLVPYGGTDLSVPINGGGPRSCSGGDDQAADTVEGWSPTLQNVETRKESGGQAWAGSFKVPVLCDVLGVTGSGTLLGHWNSDRLPGDWNDPNDGNGTVVALDIQGADFPFEDPALRRVVATAGAPLQVTVASDLIGAALDADEGGAS